MRATLARPRVLSIRALIVLAALRLAPAAAQELPPAMGQNLPLYPGLYFTGGLLVDPRDSAYDQSGNKRDTVAPAAGGRSSFPEKVGIAQFTWHFPMFESYGFPYFSSRTHLARVTLRYGRTRTDGQLDSYVQTQSSFYDVQNAGSGLGDTQLEFGTFLLGANDWRTRKDTPFAALATLGVTAPTGVYERYAPNNLGDNAWAFHGKLGFHGVAWPGGMVEGELGMRTYARNEEPAFGGLAPHKQGRDRFWDASVTQRFWHTLYAGAFVSWRRGAVNEYRDPQFSPNPNNPPPPAPGPPPAPQTSDTYPTPGRYFDQGTQLSVFGLNAHYFLGQRWLASLSWSRPWAGQSGEFDLPFTGRTPANCLVGASSCNTAPNGSAHEDGYGPARSYASASWLLSFTHNFRLGDAFSCTGCEK